MIKHMLQNEKPFLALISANGILGAAHKFLIVHQPEFTSFLTLLQIAIAIMTIMHFSRKYVQYLMASAKEARAVIHTAEEKAKGVIHDAAEAAKQKLTLDK